MKERIKVGGEGVHDNKHIHSTNIYLMHTIGQALF